MRNFGEVVADIRMRGIVGTIIDEKEYVIIVPVQRVPDLFIRIKYEHNFFSKDTVKKVQLLCTSERPDLYYDLYYSDAVKTKVIRESKPETIHGLLVMQTLTLTELEDAHGREVVNIDPSKLSVKTYLASNFARTSVEDIVVPAGWVGMMNYSACKSKLDKSKVSFDDRTEEVFFTIPTSDQINLVVDFDKRDADIKAMVILPTPKFVGMTMQTKAGYKKFYSVMHSIAKPVCGGSKHSFFEVQLDDVPFGTYFRDMFLDVFDLTEEYVFNLAEVCGFWHFNNFVYFCG
jgi:hypothetical protein